MTFTRQDLLSIMALAENATYSGLEQAKIGMVLVAKAQAQLAALDAPTTLSEDIVLSDAE